MKQIQKLCDEEWAATGRGGFARGGKEYAIWHDAFITAFRLARELAAKTVGALGPPDPALLHMIRRLGEENV